MPKRKLTRDKASIEDIYCNKHFVPPKEQNLETIFEEPRQSKDGAPILTSVKKYKRYLHFDPTQNKIQKRKKKAKKCCNKLKTNYRITRSSPENAKSDNISLYILEALGDNSSDSDISASTIDGKVKNGLNLDPSSILTKDVTCSDICDTPKKNRDSSKSYLHCKDERIEDTPVISVEEGKSEVSLDASFNESQKPITDIDDGTGDSPRRSCYIS